ncbi:uncharacterized protein [Haliotis cracherodii]|uniref:uncharacterized protein n=1 Tax=Haliotis cracherodii TaxID=6455 RepID=UPI0039EBDBD3
MFPDIFVLLFLTCVFTPGPEPAGTCAACTDTYDSATTDEDCGHLKTYLDCLETAAGTSAGCDLSTDQATKIKDATCNPVLDSPCTCQKTFWGSDLSENNACGPLETYIQCLTDAGDIDTCETGVKASDIIDKPKGRLTALTCNTAVSTLGMYSTSVLLPFALMTFFC